MECFAFVVVSDQLEQLQQGLAHLLLEARVVELEVKQFRQHFGKTVELRTIYELFFIMLEESRETLEDKRESGERECLVEREELEEVIEQEMVELGEQGLESESEGQSHLEEHSQSVR